MTTALMERPQAAPAQLVSAEELDLVKKTVAKDATDAELKLYLYDCARQGVHPLDRLLHFTKRGGRYTPVTSIDLMRTRAADTGEYAGSDDAVFIGSPSVPEEFAATVAVWRLVQGHKCSFTATARWSEYKPDSAHMWQRMPHTMLAKCAEALALRKGFPRQLAGLYAAEEMAQADRGAQSRPPAVLAPSRVVVPTGIAAVQILSSQATEWGGDITVVDEQGVESTHKTADRQLASLCEQLAQDAVPVTLEFAPITRGVNKGKQKLVGVHRIITTPAPPAAEMVPASDIAF